MNQQERFYKVWADVGELVLGVMTGAAFIVLSRRISLLCRGIWIPSSGTCDTHVAAALMDLAEPSMDVQLRKRNIPRAQPGLRSIVRIADLTGEFTAQQEPVTPSRPKRKQSAAPVKRKK